MNECVLDTNKPCTGCGRCNVCDLDETKLCDNCCRCFGDAEYRAIEITKIIMPPEIKLKRRKIAKK